MEPVHSHNTDIFCFISATDNNVANNHNNYRSVHYCVKPRLSQHDNMPATASLVSVLLVRGTEITRDIGLSPDVLVRVTEITRDIGPSPYVLVREADHTSSLEIVCPGHLAHV